MKKMITTLLLMSLVCCLFAGCQEKKEQRAVTDEETQAIQEVIKAFDQAYYHWDEEGMRACVTEEYFQEVENPVETTKNAFSLYVETGDMVPEDFEKYMEIEKKPYLLGAESVQYRNWDISLSGDTATVKITYGYPDSDSKVPLYGEGLRQYRDPLFVQVCGMDEATAKASLSPEEFSSVYLQVTDLDYTKRSENMSYIESVAELRMKKIDGKWYIAEFVPSEE